MKRYELKYTKGEEGVFRMSTVESPAIKLQLVMFDDELRAMEFQDDDKQVIYSVAMRPNMLIPRKDVNGEPAMVFYSEDTVNDLQQNFFKNGSNKGATVNHDGKVRDDIYAFESWIVSDTEKDKATLLGLDVRKGDWVLGQKVDNPDVWAKIKNKELTGFSIEAYLEPVLITKEINMTEEEVDARIRKVLMESDMAFKVGDKVKLIADPEKEFTVSEVKDDGTFSLADADGVISDGHKAEELEAVVAVTAAADGEPAPDLQKTIDEQATEIIALKAQLAELEAGKVEMSAQLVATKKVAVEMGEQLAKGIPANPGKKIEEMSPLERFRASK